MKNIPTNTFDNTVTQFFGPVAQRANLPLKTLREGIYEIAGVAFRLRIRRGIGHRKDFLVTLSPNKAGDLDDLKSEIGLGVIAEYHDEPLRVHQLDTEKDWQLALEEAADAAERFCIPYLTGKQSDLEGVRQFIEHKIEESGIRTKKYGFPRNVREEWL